MLKRSDLPQEILEVILFLESKKVIYYIVGGFSRDYLLSKKIAKDIDIEVKALPLAWLEEIETKFKVKVKVLPYDIVSFSLGSYQFELQAPRLEVYKNEIKNGHHDFDVSIDANLPPAQSFKRRDFTINAIGLSFEPKKENIIITDPFNGLDDIKEKKLRTMNPDFFLDPVRFLRILRFKSNFQLSLDASLESSISQFDLRSLTSFYLRKEYMAAFEKEAFCQSLVHYQQKFKLSLDHLALDIETCAQFSKCEGTFFSESGLFTRLCESHGGNFLPEKILKQQTFLQISKYGKVIFLWKAVKELMKSTPSNLTADHLQSLSSWERFIATDFFREAHTHFSEDLPLINKFLKICSLKLGQQDLVLIETLPIEQRSLHSWQVRLRRYLE